MTNHHLNHRDISSRCSICGKRGYLGGHCFGCGRVMPPGRSGRDERELDAVEYGEQPIGRRMADGEALDGADDDSKLFSRE